MKTIPVSDRAAVLLTFTLVTLVSALGNLSQTALNAMMVPATADLGVSVVVGQWFSTSYMLALGVAVLLSSFLTKRMNDRSFILLGMGLFVAGSAVSFFSAEFFGMLGGRLLQAFSSGFLMTTMQTIAMRKFPPSQSATAMGVAGIAMGFAPNIGPTVGGALCETYGWRSFFFVMIAVSAVLFVAAFLFVRKEECQRQALRGSQFGAFILSGIAFSGLLLGTGNASTEGFASVLSWLPVAIGAVCLFVFIRWQLRDEAPLINMGIFKNPSYTFGFAAQCLLFGSFMGVTLVIPLYVTVLCGGTSTDAGMVMFPSALLALIVNPVAGFLCSKHGARKVCLVGGAFLVTGSVLACLCTDASPLWMITVTQVIRGVGVSSMISPLITFSLGDLRSTPSLIADGSSFSVVTRQAAAGVGTSVMMLALSVVSSLAVPAALAYQAAFAVSALLAIAMYAIVVLKVR